MPKETGRVHVTDPAGWDFGGGNIVWLVSLCVPVKDGDTTIGVFGIDFRLNELVAADRRPAPLGRRPRGTHRQWRPLGGASGRHRCFVGAMADDAFYKANAEKMRAGETVVGEDASNLLADPMRFADKAKADKAQPPRMTRRKLPARPQAKPP